MNHPAGWCWCCAGLPPLQAPGDLADQHHPPHWQGGYHQHHHDQPGGQLQRQILPEVQPGGEWGGEGDGEAGVQQGDRGGGPHHFEQE